jgi:glycine cleavage system H protein
VSPSPTDRKYSRTHEWFLLQADVVTIGITRFAADELTDITFVDLPAVGSTVAAGQACGEIESVKATSELFTAVGGEVIEVNQTLADAPQQVNNDPFGQGWMLKIRVSDPSSLDKLMDAGAYDEMLTRG